MKRGRRLIIIASVALVAIVAAVIAYQTYIVPLLEWYPEDAIMDGPPDILLDSVQVGDKTARFYIDYSRDCAVFGYFVEDDTGAPRYFVVSGSTFRGLHRKTVEVFLSETGEEMWVRVNPPPEGGYFRADESFIAKYGYDTPTPTSSYMHGSQHPGLPPEAKKAISFTVGDQP